MATLYIPVYHNGRREVWQIVPRWRCFADASNAHAVFIDGYHLHDDTIFRTEEAAWRYWAKLYIPTTDRYTVAEIVAAAKPAANTK